MPIEKGGECDPFFPFPYKDGEEDGENEKRFCLVSKSLLKVVLSSPSSSFSPSLSSSHSPKPWLSLWFLLILLRKGEEEEDDLLDKTDAFDW